MLRFIRQSWFLVVLCLALGVGVTWGDRLALGMEAAPKELIIALVMVSISLATDFRALMAGRGNWTAVGLAVLINTALAPPLGWLFGLALAPSLAQGLVLAMAVPCTIASAIVWTRRGGGNDVATAMVTLITSFACFLVLPFWTGLLLGKIADVPPLALALRLIACVAAPMLVGQLVRLSPAVAAWANGAKAGLGVFSQCGVLLIAFLGGVKAGQVLYSSNQLPRPFDWVALVAVVIALHLLLLVIGWLLARGAGLARPEQLTVLIGGSQKTFAVGAGVVLLFGPMAIFPLVAYHFTQLVVDTLLVDFWRRQSQ